MPIGYVYKLVTRNDHCCYIGSTGNLQKRLKQHEYIYNRGILTSAGAVIRHGDYFMELLRVVNYNDISELRAIEGQYIRDVEHCTNKYVAGRNKREQQYEQKNCPCGGHYIMAHKQRHFESFKHQNYMAWFA